MHTLRREKCGDTKSHEPGPDLLCPSLHNMKTRNAASTWSWSMIHLISPANIAGDGKNGNIKLKSFEKMERILNVCLAVKFENVNLSNREIKRVLQKELSSQLERNKIPRQE